MPTLDYQARVYRGELRGVARRVLQWIEFVCGIFACIAGGGLLVLALIAARPLPMTAATLFAAGLLMLSAVLGHNAADPPRRGRACILLIAAIACMLIVAAHMEQLAIAVQQKPAGLAGLLGDLMIWSAYIQVMDLALSAALVAAVMLAVIAPQLRWNWIRVWGMKRDIAGSDSADGP